MRPMAGGTIHTDSQSVVRTNAISKSPSLSMIPDRTLLGICYRTIFKRGKDSSNRKTVETFTQQRHSREQTKVAWGTIEKIRYHNRCARAQSPDRRRDSPDGTPLSRNYPQRMD